MLKTPVLLSVAVGIFIGAASLPTFAESSPRLQDAGLEQVLEAFRRRRSPWQGISRGDGQLCAVSPGVIGDENMIWSDRPFFIWQGNARTIQVLDFSTQNLVWSSPITQADQIAMVINLPLQQGAQYVWILSDGKNSYESLFKIMPTEARDQLTKDLQKLEQDLQSNGATDEAIAVAQANYFSQKNLWSDALQRLYSVENPSVEVVQAQQQLMAELCRQGS